MIDIVPRSLLPRALLPAQRKDYIVCLSCCFCLLGGTLLAWNDLTVLPGSSAGHFLNKVREVIHPSWFPCPFCGGTRSFVCCCRGDFFSAMHYSLGGCLVFWWMLLNAPLRGAMLLFSKFKTRHPGIGEAITLMDSSRLQMRMLLSVWVTQLALHILGILSWYPAS